jgi:transaldolase
MKFFIDTANLAQIKEAHDLGILDGVTTNPSLMAKEGIKGEEAIMNHYKTICEIVDGDISAEVLSTEFNAIIAEGQKLAAIHPNIVVKVPMIKDGVKAIKWFTDNGIRTNCTLYSLLVRLFWLQKQVPQWFLHLSAVSMTATGMA